MLAPANYCFLLVSYLFVFVCLQPVKMMHSAPLRSISPVTHLTGLSTSQIWLFCTDTQQRVNSIGRWTQNKTVQLPHFDLIYVASTPETHARHFRQGDKKACYLLTALGPTETDTSRSMSCAIQLHQQPGGHMSLTIIQKLHNHYF